MALPREQFTVRDEFGNIIAGASCRVTLESDGSLVTLYTDELGATPAGNPVYSDGDGFVFFHVQPGVYKIVTTSGSFEAIRRFVNLGTAVTDGVTPGIQYNFNNADHVDSDPGPGAFKTNHATFLNITTLFVDNVDANGNTVTSILDTWDDNNNPAHRGTLEIRSVATPSVYGLFVVTGSVVDGTGYRKLTVTPVAGDGTLSGIFAFNFTRTGVSGSMSPTGSVTSQRLARFADSSGYVLEDSGVVVSTDGTMAANSNAKVPTEAAILTYLAAFADLLNLFQLKTDIDCSANPNYPAASKGHAYLVSVAGKIGGASGINVEVSDLLICKVDGSASGNQATVGANWAIVQMNIVDSANLAWINLAQQWSKPQRSAATALVASTAWDGTSAMRLTAAVSSAFLIANPSAALDGCFYHIEITYSGTGPVTFGNQFKGISAITWTNASGKKDRATFQWNAANSEMEYVGHSLDVRA